MSKRKIKSVYKSIYGVNSTIGFSKGEYKKLIVLRKWLLRYVSSYSNYNCLGKKETGYRYN